MVEKAWFIYLVYVELHTQDKVRVFDDSVGDEERHCWHCRQTIDLANPDKHQSYSRYYQNGVHRDLVRTSLENKDTSVLYCSNWWYDYLPQALFLCNICVVFKPVLPFWNLHFVHALTNATDDHKYSPLPSADFDIAEVLMSFLELRFLGKMALLLPGLRGALSLSKSPLKVKRDIFERKWMR